MTIKARERNRYEQEASEFAAEAMEQYRGYL